MLELRDVFFIALLVALAAHGAWLHWKIRKQHREQTSTMQSLGSVIGSLIQCHNAQFGFARGLFDSLSKILNVPGAKTSSTTDSAKH